MAEKRQSAPVASSSSAAEDATRASGPSLRGPVLLGRSGLRIGHWSWQPGDPGPRWSDEVYRIHGLCPSSGPVTLERALAACHPDDRGRVEAELERAVAEARPFRFEHRLIRESDGAVRRVLVAADCQGEPGAVERVFGVVVDLTELVEAEHRAEIGRHRLALAADAAELGIWDFDVVHDVLVWDARMFELYDVDPTGFRGEFADWQRTLHPEDLPRARAELEAALAARAPFRTRFRIIRRDGAVRHLDAQAQVITDADDRPIRVIGVNRDVTSRIEQEERFQSAVQGFPVGCLFVDHERRIRMANRAAEALLGAEPGGLEDLGVDAILPSSTEEPRLVDPRARSEEVLAARRAVEARRLDGETICVHLGVGVLEASPRPAVLLSLTDLSEQRALEARLAETQRLQAIGLLAGGIAHDFNNLLSAVFCHVDLLEDADLTPDEAAESLAAIRKLGQRGAALTQRLLAYSRRQRLAPTSTDLQAVFEDLDTILVRTLPEYIDVETRVAPDTWPVEVDRHQLEDALVNLAVNAQHAMPEGGRLRLEAHNHFVEAWPRGGPDDLEPGPYVRLRVIDEGVGMTPDVIARAFDPFFTTRAVGEGSGLGLSMVYGFVRQSRGHVAIDSRPGAGTTVTIDLPRGRARRPEAPPADLALPSITGRVLLVEDDQEVRRVTAKTLAAAGHEVLEAQDGAEALALLRTGPPPDLLFTDITLPGGISGLDVAARAQQLDPSLPVVFTTGYARDATSPALDGADVLDKPYTHHAVLSTIERGLRRARGPSSTPARFSV